MSFELILSLLRPIESLLLDESVSQIMGYPDASCFYERDGRLCREESISFEADKLRTGLEVIANQLGKRLGDDNPRLQARLPDGSRFAAWIPPIVSPAPAIATRKCRSRHYAIDDLIGRGTLTQPIVNLLAEQIRNGKTLLISGWTGSGKTTLLRMLANSIPGHEPILVIEDTPELHIRKANIVAAQSQTDTLRNTISFDDLFKDTLRFKLERIILGEVRGIEARTLLDSLNRGHTGSLATIHASSAEKALRRFVSLVTRSHAQSSVSDVEDEIGEAVDFVVHVERQPGWRIVREVLALRGCDHDPKHFLIEPVFETQRPESSTTGGSGSTPDEGQQLCQLLEINQIRHTCASVRIDEPTAARMDQCSASIEASADDVVDKALNYVFSKDRDFQEFLKTPQAMQVASTLRVRKAVTSGAPEQPGKKAVTGVESTPSVRAEKASSGFLSAGSARTVLRTGRIFDTPSLKGVLQRASSAQGLLPDMTRLRKCPALWRAPGLPRKESLCR